MLIINSKILSGKKLEKMPRSQNEWSRSRLNKSLLVKWNCNLIE